MPSRECHLFIKSCLGDDNGPSLELADLVSVWHWLVWLANAAAEGREGARGGGQEQELGGLPVASPGGGLEPLDHGKRLALCAWLAQRLGPPWC